MYCGITASEVADLFCLGYLTPSKRFMKKVNPDKIPDNDPIDSFAERAKNHGIKYEEEARRDLETKLGTSIATMGILIHEGLEDCMLAGSPDGYIHSTKTVVEIKCPYRFTYGETANMAATVVRIRKPYNTVKLGHLIQVIVLMELLQATDCIYHCYAVTEGRCETEGGNYIETKTFRVPRQKEIFDDILLPEIRRFLTLVAIHAQGGSATGSEYRGATMDIKRELMKRLLAINPRQLNL